MAYLINIILLIEDVFINENFKKGLILWLLSETITL